MTTLQQRRDDLIAEIVAATPAEQEQIKQFVHSGPTTRIAVMRELGLHDEADAYQAAVKAGRA